MLPVACPICQAAPGQPCTRGSLNGKRKEISVPHPQRRRMADTRPRFANVKLGPTTTTSTRT